MALAGVHHSAICTSDVERSMRFWCDGMGLAEIFDVTFAGEWGTLFGAREDSLRSIFLGDPATPDSGLVELVIFEGAAPGEPAWTAPAHGFFLLSFHREVEPTLATLAGLGFADGVRRIVQPAMGGKVVDMGVVDAPDGVVVELVGPQR
jgi:catechol 2,3-dioxygenase-like lactoylglutathione lyase family enzyme